MRLVAAATAAAATTAAGKSAGGFRRRAVARAGGRAEYRELNRVFLAGTLGAGDFLLLVDNDLLESGAAVFANVFVNRHLVNSLS